MVVVMAARSWRVSSATVGDGGFERSLALIDAGVDVVVIDTAHGHNADVLKAVARLRREANRVQIVAGNNQSATVGRTLPIEPSVRVTDANNNPIAGLDVLFEVTSGGGTAVSRRQTTNALGVATVGDDDASGLRVKGVRALLDAAVGAPGYGRNRPLEITFTVPRWAEEEGEEGEGDADEPEGEGEQGGGAAAPPAEEEEGGAAAAPSGAAGDLDASDATAGGAGEEAGAAAAEGEDAPDPLPPAADLIRLRFTRKPCGFGFRGDSLAATQLATTGGQPPAYCRCVVTDVRAYCEAPEGALSRRIREGATDPTSSMEASPAAAMVTTMGLFSKARVLWARAS
jgi:hypothetical protein